MGSGKGKGGAVAMVEGVANSSHGAEGRGTEVASKETRLLEDERRGRMALVGVEEEVAVLLEEREEARTREDIVRVVGWFGLWWMRLGFGYEMRFGVC